ncbi:MAG: NFYB/HAP3 family transcription factor subunit [Candidatus Marsarchaeota archaeon]|nr:NFYB/HAP3 family transcription factor subunit [Candidatus Marsarchaeota archaeon]MCL5094507.1 NFYB/HAP3 family transcription factor subunit [Candidatus Marsarchaeota archaeon]
MAKSKKNKLSFYDIEQFLRDAGAEKINEGAVDVFEKELEETVDELIKKAKIYANYAGRKKLIKDSDIKLILNKETKRAIKNQNQIK